MCKSYFLNEVLFGYLYRFRSLACLSVVLYTHLNQCHFCVRLFLTLTECVKLSDLKTLTASSVYIVCSVVYRYLLLACDERVRDLLTRVSSVIIACDLLNGFSHVCVK